MKKLFLMFAVAGLTLTAIAQKTEKQVATLQHGDQTMVFYGIDAFKQAYAAAADTLDVITLSSGEFNGPSYIEKSITVYGAGFENDTIIGSAKTIVKNFFCITANGVHLEGICFRNSFSEPAELSVGLNEDSYYSGEREPNYAPIHNLSIVKCHLKVLWFIADSYNCVIRQSYIYNFIGSMRARDKYYPGLGPQVFVHNLLISNNYIQGVKPYYINNPLNNGSRSFFDFDTSSTIMVDHCILMSDMMSGDWHYTNNVIKEFGPCGSHNIFLGNDTPTKSEDNWVNVAPEYVWAAEGEDGTYAENKDFALKLPTYIATDGTEIGLHGGVYAWNKTPSIPRIIECIINTEDVPNGTLKVSIKAEAQTKE